MTISFHINISPFRIEVCTYLKNEYKKKRYCSSVPAGDFIAGEFVNLLAIPLPLLGV
nr:MAG TPA: hypothetical protein [Caudoviricetes sp.]